jgi:hypothetical protein
VAKTAPLFLGEPVRKFGPTRNSGDSRRRKRALSLIDLNERNDSITMSAPRPGLGLCSTTVCGTLFGVFISVGLGSLRSGESGEVSAARRFVDFAPEVEYERHGDVDDVVFPCGYTINPDGDTLNIYRCIG